MKLTDKDIFSIAACDLGSYAVLQFPEYELVQHLNLITDHLEAVEQGEISRLLITTPPRHGKTMLTSEFFPAWYLGRNPEKFIIFITYSQERANDVGRKVRNQLTDPLHQSIFPNCKISEDSAASNKFNTNQNGAYYAVGVGGPITGRGAHLLIIDDPIKGREDADSPTQRRKLIEWFQSVAYTRLMPGGAIILIQTRWHEEDLAGWLLKGHEKWVTLNLPALAEENDPLNRETGAPLWPKFYPKERLLEIKRTIGDREFNALYQQRPTSIEGNLFKRGWWQYYETQPLIMDGILQSWDCAYEQGEDSSFSVCQTWAAKDGHFYLLNQLRKRLAYPDLVRAVKEMARLFSPEKILIEKAASGRSLVQDLWALTRLPIKAIPTTNKSKEERAFLITDFIEAGRVWLPKNAKWLNEFVDELAHFPNGKFTDQTDALTMALQFMKLNQLRHERSKNTSRPSSGRPPIYSTRPSTSHLLDPNSGFFDKSKEVHTSILHQIDLEK
jgi:predicted phage terminase large subunit-like protein